MQNILNDYKLIIVLQDYTRIECQELRIDPLTGLIYTDNIDHPVINTQNVAHILIQGEL